MQNNFKPFSTHLDLDNTLQHLQNATLGGDDGELFIEYSQSESLLLDDGYIKNASYSTHQGFGLRTIHGATIGYSHSNEITEKAVKKAADVVKRANREGLGKLVQPPTFSNSKYYGSENPIEDDSFGKKVDLLQAIDTYCRELDTRIVQATVNLFNSYQSVWILHPDGHLVNDERPMTRMVISVIVNDKGHRETGYTGKGGRYSSQSLLAPSSWQSLADEAYRIACVNLEAEPAPAGVMDVVLGSGWPGILLHEAIGHGLEGDFNRKKTSAFAGLMGKQIASKGVTVLDDGTLNNCRGSISIDDEGTPGQSTLLIDDGILVGYMQDRQNGRLMGGSSTGNGRRQSFAHQPMPRMTNTYMVSGEANPDDIVAEVEDGIHAIGFGGGQVDITSGKFVFSCVEAYRVKNGKRKQPIKGATLIGDGPTVLKNIRLIGNDMALDPGIGTCGKDGQWVPVGVGQPSILIGGLTVGGSQGN